jgi:signal transduction histidine kinase
LLKQAGSGTIELTLQRGDGTRMPVELVCTTSQTGDGAVEIRLTIADITERRRAEQAEQQAQVERIEAARRQSEISRHLISVQEDARRRLACRLHDDTSSNLATLIIISMYWQRRRSKGTGQPSSHT